MANVALGVYRLKNYESGTYLDAHIVNPGVIEAWKANDLPNQYWLITKIGDAYTFRNIALGTYLQHSGLVNNSKVRASNDPPVYWWIHHDGDYRIICPKDTELALDVDGGLKASGTSINLWQINDNPQQKWTLEKTDKFPRSLPIPFVPCYIQSVMSSAALDIDNGHLADGLPVVAWHTHRGSQQMWKLEKGDVGFKIRNVDGRYLGFKHGDKIGEGTVVTGNRNNPVEWLLQPEKEGWMLRYSGTPWLVLEIKGNNFADGATICVWSRNNGPNQRWIFTTAMQ